MMRYVRLLASLLVLLLPMGASAQNFVCLPCNPLLPLQFSRSQVNMGYDFSLIFLNRVKEVDPWWKRSDNVVVDPTRVDTNGYPLYDASATSFGGWTITPQIPLQYSRPGHYVLTWTGYADMESLSENTAGGNGNVANVSCTGSGGGTVTAFCNNTGCSTFTAFITSGVLNVTTAPTGTGCFPLVVGQPISGAGITDLLKNGQDFGAPTLITGLGTNSSGPCSSGSPCQYTLNTSPTVSSETMFPGGRAEISITGETIYSSNLNFYNYNIGLATLKIQLNQTGTATHTAQHASNIALMFHCSNSVPGSCTPGGPMDDEALYWTGQLVDPQFANEITASGIGIIRDLGLAGSLLGNWTTWATRKPAAYWSYQTSELRCGASCGQGSTQYYVNPTQSTVTTNFTGQIGATFSGTASGTTNLVVSGISAGSCIQPGDTITGSGAPAGWQIISGPGGNGTYVTNKSPTVSGTFTTSNCLAVSAVGSGALQLSQYLDSAHASGFIDDGLGGGAFDGVAGTTLTITSTFDGTIAANDTIYDGNGIVQSGVKVVSGPTTCGSNSCYVINTSTKVNPTSLVNSNGTGILNFSNPNIGAQTQITGQITGTAGSTGTYSTAGPGAVTSSASLTVFTYRYTSNIDAVPPVDKETIVAQWGTPNSATPTGGTNPNPSATYVSMDNGTTYRPVINPGGALNMIKNVPISGYIGSLVYDKDLSGGAWLGWTGFSTQCCGLQNAIGILNFIPPEAYVEIANELGVEPEITEGYMAADPITDFSAQYALYIKTNFPSMLPIFAIPDETWNGNQNNSIYAQEKTSAYAALDSNWPGSNVQASDNDNWSGKVATNLCESILQVYGSTTKYRCFTGANTNNEWNFLSSLAPRLTSAAYVAQNKSVLPVQSGCAGPGAIQTVGCSFSAAPACQYATDMEVHDYWIPAEQGQTQKGTLPEVIDGYNFYNGNPTTQNAILAAYLTTTQNQYFLDTIQNFNTTLYPPYYAATQNCSGLGGSIMAGLGYYEGGYNNPMLLSDVKQNVASATRHAGGPCVLNTSLGTVTSGVINSDGNPAHTTPGNILSGGGANYSDAIYGATATGTGVTGTPTILGTAYSSTGNTLGLAISGSAQYVPSTTITLYGNAAIAGMKVQLTNTVSENGTYFVETGPTQQGIPLLQSDGVTPYDCVTPSDFNNSTLTYTGSAQQISFMVNSSYVYSGLQSYATQMYNITHSFGAMAAAELKMADINTPGTGWLMMGQDIFGYWPLAVDTSATLSGSTLTLNTGSTIYGRFQAGQTIYGGGVLSNTYTLGTCTPVGGATGPCGTNPGDTFAVSPSGGSFANQAIDGVIFMPTTPIISGAKVYNQQYGG